MNLATDTADVGIPVAQYVRMSTEHQRYSIENQQLAIADYALLHGMRIVKTYADTGKSGLNIEGRLKLQQLLADVQTSDVGYRAILVYDVSRWGRFPDPDEAAMYSALAIRERFRLLDGICNEAISLLADKPIPRGVFPVLRGMKAFRQIDVANIMINLNNYSLKFARAMLHATSPEELTNPKKPKILSGNALETLQRLERELALVQADTKLLEESYGPANLQLTIIKTHIKSILDNARIVKWLLKSNPEYLEQLQLIAESQQTFTGSEFMGVE